ncbi:MAG TPA: ABC transporter permease [Candidatus Acidoferrales bacterium]|nr:ABC transporter permease [Candidatus Acidoferrales bacterium]
MNWISRFFRRSKLDSQLDSELQFHVEQQTAENVAAGMDPGEARRRALAQFGGLEYIKEETRDARGTQFVESLAQDVRFALRMLRKSPGFTAVAVITLALGIGANTAMFSVVNAVVLRPLPYAHSERLVWIAESVPALKSEAASGGDYVDWKDQNHTLERIAAYDTMYRGSLREGAGGPGSADFNLTRKGTPARVHSAFVSASFFGTLGAEPQIGRAFTDKEDEPSGPRVVVLMHSFWQQYFGSDARVLGQTVDLDTAPYTIIGVMPASFRFPGDSDTQILLPLALNQAQERLRVLGQRQVRIIGLLKPGVSLAAARADLDEIRKRAQESSESAAAARRGRDRATLTAGAGGHGGRVRRSTSDRDGGPPPASELEVMPLAEHLAGNLRPAMLILLGAVGLVLLIACANIANLMLTRASGRTREMAVRAILGAGRWRLVRQLLAESVTLAVAGGVAGLLLAAWGVGAMARLIPASAGGGILAVAAPRVDGNVLLFALAVSVVTGILFGLAPAVAATRSDLAEGLKEGAQAASPGVRRGRLRGALAVAEVSLALVLLIGAGLLIKSFYRLLEVNPGFTPEHVLTMDLSLTDTRYPTRQQQSEFFSEVLRRVESLPGVRSAAVADSLPLSPYQAFLMLARTGLLPRAALLSSTPTMMYQITVSPAYFSTLEIPVLKGRTFTEHDEEQSLKVAVVNETLARLLWPNEDPIGRHLPLFHTLTVVGVVGNTHHEGLTQNTEAEVYVPYLQLPQNSMQLAVRTAADPDSMVSAVRAQVRDVDPDQPLYHVGTLEQTLAESVAPRRFNMLLLGIFAGIAFVLATVGIYGVMAFSVVQRTHEIGIRMALGARTSDVLGMVVRQGLKLTAVGVTIGIAGALVLTRFLASLLFGVRPNDAVTFVGVSLILGVVALVACYIPARRAMRVDPMVALRYE